MYAPRPHTCPILRSANDLGVCHYRMDVPHTTVEKLMAGFERRIEREELDYTVRPEHVWRAYVGGRAWAAGHPVVERPRHPLWTKLWTKLKEERAGS